MNLNLVFYLSIHDTKKYVLLSNELTFDRKWNKKNVSDVGEILNYNLLME